MPSNFFKNYIKELTDLLEGIVFKEFEDFIEVLISAYERKSQIFIFGNGGSATSASHFACDINKGVFLGYEKRFKIICLNDNIPTILAYANDFSYDEVFVEQLKNFLSNDDLIIGVSGSGNSKNVLNALEYANENGAKTFGVCGFDGGKLKAIAHKSLVINSFDIQKVEDLHLIVFHCTMKFLNDVYALVKTPYLGGLTKKPTSSEKPIVLMRDYSRKPNIVKEDKI